MQKMILAGERSFETEDSQTVRLAYYMIEDYRDIAAGSPLYGVRIIKQTKRKGRLVQEKETANAISYSKELVQSMLDKLIRNMVTPLAMLEVVDDMVTEALYV